MTILKQILDMQLNAYEQKSRKNYSLNKLVTVLVMVFTPTGMAIRGIWFKKW